jgi:thiamine pyrophosphate-dependent acetolactate synthase large subunit-like protein
MTFPNEIEKTKAEIKVLEAKLSLLEEMEKHKTPCEIAFKSVYGCYPTEAKWNAVSWQSFQKGYNAAKEEKGSEYQPTPQTPEQVAQGLRDAMKQAKAEGVFDEPEPKEATLYDLIADWWDEIFVNGNPSGQNIESLVEKISEWLPDAIVTDIGRSELWNAGYNAYRKILMGKLK